MGSQERAKAMVTVVTSFTTRLRFWKNMNIGNVGHRKLVRQLF
jgi:hypothetical protein